MKGFNFNFRMVLSVVVHGVGGGSPITVALENRVGVGM